MILTVHYSFFFFYAFRTEFLNSNRTHFHLIIVNCDLVFKNFYNTILHGLAFEIIQQKSSQYGELCWNIQSAMKTYILHSRDMSYFDLLIEDVWIQFLHLKLLGAPVYMVKGWSYISKSFCIYRLTIIAYAWQLKVLALENRSNGFDFYKAVQQICAASFLEHLFFDKLLIDLQFLTNK